MTVEQCEKCIYETQSCHVYYIEVVSTMKMKSHECLSFIWNGELK